MNAKPYSFRLDPSLKAQADALFAALGLNTNAAVSMFLRQSIAEQGLPFRPSLCPNEETLAAMRETLAGENLSGPYQSATDLFAALEETDGKEEAP